MGVQRVRTLRAKWSFLKGGVGMGLQSVRTPWAKMQGCWHEGGMSHSKWGEGVQLSSMPKLRLKLRTTDVCGSGSKS